MKYTIAMFAAAASSAILAATVSAQQLPELVPPTSVGPQGNPMFSGGAYGYPAGQMPPGYPAGQMPPGYPAPGMGAGPQGGPDQLTPEQKRYGFNPYLANLFGSKDCAGCNKRKKKTPPQVPEKVPMPVAQGGTLVFPNHPFVRSPRDYFMSGERGAAWGE